MLERLARVQPVPDAGRHGEDAEPSYRYHSLFADFLRAQLAREQPDDLLRLHLAAAGWYESVGRPVPAIDHAHRGRRLSACAALLAAQRASASWSKGRMRLLGALVRRIPEASCASIR